MDVVYRAIGNKAMVEGDAKMTPEEINKALAEKVMGFSVTDTRRLYYTPEKGACMLKSDWDPWTRIDHAWMVVEAFNGCLHLRQHNKHGLWAAFFCDAGPDHEGEADTAPAAICNAALLAIGEKDVQERS